MFVLIDDDDPAIELLSAHFKSVIQASVEGTYQQLPPTREITRELAQKKKKTYFFTSNDCATLWRTVDNVETKWLGAKNISRRLKELKNKVSSEHFLMLCRWFGASKNFRNVRMNYQL